MRSASHFRLKIGAHIEPREVHGYYIDLREKALDPRWPPPWFPFPGYHRHIAGGQWGLAAFERFVAGEGARWLDGARAAGEHLVATQQPSGAWEEPEDYPHTFRMRGPWLSAMAQGHCASLLVRLHGQTGEAAFARSAREALRPYHVPAAAGGVLAHLDGGAPFYEEYPTRPPSYVLNGAIYALWGLYDVAIGLADDDVERDFAIAVDALAANIGRWDLGYWSRYDLYPHPAITNIASASYHALHINQLRVLCDLAPRPALAAAAQRFATYARRPRDRTRALTHKVAFRLVVPRNPALAARLPWTQQPHDPAEQLRR